MSRPSSRNGEPTDSVKEPRAYAPGQTTAVNQSWRDLYDRLGNVIRYYARQGGLNEHSADNVLQEVMVTVLRAQLGQVAGYDPARGSFKAWLFGIMRYRIKAEQRKDRKEYLVQPQGRSDSDEDDHPHPEPVGSPEDFAEREEQHWRAAIAQAALRKVQAKVSPENFAIFMALVQEEASPAALAQKYHKAPNNIYQIKNRCLAMAAAEAKALRQIYEPPGPAAREKGSYAE